MSSEFRVVAIVAAYNEEDVIDLVVGDLIRQGLHVYVLDDGSTDGTVAAIERHLGRGVLAIERLAATSGGDAPHRFEWERILLRKTALARELDADWFLHHDADEFRESPWPGVSLNDAITRVDALGFNAIDFASFNFWPVHDRFRPGEDVRDAFTSYAEAAPHDHVQIRCWKKTANLDLASSGGHEARFPDRRVFPLRFVLRHYPIRGQGHGERKIFRERQTRFSDEERARGWHVQYDDVVEGTSFVRDPSTLTPYDPDAVRLALTLRHRGVEELEASLADARCVVESLEREIERCRGELAQTEADLATRFDEVTMLQNIANARTMDLAETRDQLAARGAEAAGLHDALTYRLAEIERWRAAVADQARRLDNFHRSRTWRWTAPARALYRLLGGS